MLQLAAIIVLGILAQWVAWRTKVPSILPLILIGLLVGPISTYFTPDGCKWIMPQQVAGSECSFLFPGQLLFYFVSLAIGIILFEGGLTLKRSEIKGIGGSIGKLISVGSLITFLGAGLAAHFIMGLPWDISFLFGGLIIVTGPTVIAPILRNVPLKKSVANILKWEGILIDPIGALAAVLVYDFIITSGEGFTSHALLAFGKILIIGFTVGIAIGYLLYWLIKNDKIPHYLLNVVTLAFVLAVFVGSDLLVHESGLLSVVVMGMVMGNLDVPHLKEILDFKESLSVLLISILFILLSANITIEHLELLLDFRVLILFLVVILLIRPLGVFASTGGSDLTTNDKLFISWVGPRGIVAAGIASLFGIKLLQAGVPGAEYITPLVFMIVLGTVLLNATTARMMARILKVTQDSSDGVMIVGAHQASRLIAKYLQDNDTHVVLLDSNVSNIKNAKNMGLEAFTANVYTDVLEDNISLTDVGYLMAMTGSTDVNNFVCNKYQKTYGEQGNFRLISSDEMKKAPSDISDMSLFSPKDDYINLIEAARDYPSMHEIAIEDQGHFVETMSRINGIDQSIPIFLLNAEGKFRMIPANFENVEIEAGSKLAYLGKEMEA